MTLCAVAMVFALTAACASASYVHVFSASFGGSGSGADELSSPGGIAVDSATHDVYVADTGNRRVDEFSASGGFIRAWGWGVADGLPMLESCTLVCQRGLSGSGAGEFVKPLYVAVDNSGGPSEGDVYVADAGEASFPAEKGWVSKFDGEGHLIESWGEKGRVVTAPVGPSEAQEPLGLPGGVAVDGSGELFVAAKLGLEHVHFYKFAEDGSFQQLLTPIGNHEFSGLALDPADQLFSIEGFPFVEKFSAGGQELGHVTPEKKGSGGPIHPATGLAIDPGPNNLLDPTASDLYVDSEGIAIDRYATSCEPKVGPCAIGDVFGEGSLSGGGQLGVDAQSHRLYVVEPASAQVVAFNAFVAPDVATEGASEVKGQSATVEGRVDANGVALSDCRFQYGAESAEEHSASCVPAAGSIPADSAIHAVSAHLENLQPGTTYHYRLSAANAGCAVCKSTGGQASFTTPPPPSVEEAQASDVSASSATLEAEVDPQGASTKYHFEWGATSEYGNTIPVPDATIAAGAGKTRVSARIEGLSANTTYDWRIVAANENGTTTTTDQTFVFDTLSAGLPDGRAYEMVTPPSKNAALIGAVFLGFSAQIAEDGGTVAALSIQCFAGAQSCVAARQAQGEPYLFSRTAGGWQTTPLAPPAGEYQTNSAWMANPDVGTALFSMPSAPAGQDDWYAREPSGSFSDVGPMTSPTLGALGVLGIGAKPMAASADGSHILFMANEAVWPFDQGAGTSVYEYAGPSSAPQMVGVSGGAGSHDLISRCRSEIGGGEAVHNNFNTLSADGSVAFFTALRCATGTGANEGVKVPATELYARIAGSRTVLVSGHDPASCTTPTCTGSAAQDALFEGASADGARVVFASTQQLTNEASQDPDKEDSAWSTFCRATAGANGCNLYEMEGVGGAGQRLIDLSAGDSSGGGPRVQGAVAISSDASHVYFIAKGVLTSTPNAEGEAARSGAENLYAYERDEAHPSGQLAFVARLSGADEEEWAEGIGQANVTPDGRYLVFTSHRGLTADATRAEGPAQVYEYDAQTGALVRVSIGQEGYGNNGNSGIADASIRPALRAFAGRLGPARPDPTMSNDGSYVFFQSPVGLTPKALDDVQIATSNGHPVYAQNIYEYHEGRVSLVSDGHDVSQLGGLSAVELLGTDATGANVFFTTAVPLVPADTDTQRDFYDARICTPAGPCVKPSPPPSPPCLGEACHGTPAATPPLFTPPTVTFNGQGNLTPPAPVAKVKPKKRKPAKCAKGKVRRHGKCVKRRAKRGKKAGAHKNLARVKSNRRGK